MLDRIDIHVEVTPVPFRDLSTVREGEKSEIIRKRVVAARKIQEERFKEYPCIHCNAQMTTKLQRKFCQVPAEGQAILRNAMEKLGLSARAYDRILKVARTIADLEGSPEIRTEHLAEAIHYRSLDRENWGK